MADYDTTGWTVYEPANCECIDAHISNVNTPGGFKPAITLTLFSHELNRKVVYFCNAIKAQVSKKNHSVRPNSNFAKLYRLTTGKNPKFSKSQQLMKHLIGEWFRCEYCQEKNKNGIPYFKVTNIKPLEPIADNNWLPDGTLKKGKPTTTNEPAKEEKNQHQTGANLAPNWQQAGTDLAPEPAEEAHNERADESNSLHKNISLARVDAYKHVPVIPISESVNEYGGRERVFKFERMNGENDDDYLQRVIDASW